MPVEDSNYDETLVILILILIFDVDVFPLRC